MSASNSPAARAERRGWTGQERVRGARFSVGGYRASDIGRRRLGREIWRDEGRRGEIRRTFGGASFGGVPADARDDGLVALDGGVHHGGVLARLLRLQSLHALGEHVHVELPAVPADAPVAVPVQRARRERDAKTTPARREARRARQSRGRRGRTRRVATELATRKGRRARRRRQGGRTHRARRGVQVVLDDRRRRLRASDEILHKQPLRSLRVCTYFLSLFASDDDAFLLRSKSARARTVYRRIA